ncbi:8223_t:CDS:2 [Entrophospora sp. SA101]|nr:1977_t:CDS:2 [Entrophospora sp. SA101]CAJ0892409.1 8223_t:CDS:2 [Entrophospora sp. SA101]
MSSQNPYYNQVHPSRHHTDPEYNNYVNNPNQSSALSVESLRMDNLRISDDGANLTPNRSNSAPINNTSNLHETQSIRSIRSTHSIRSQHQDRTASPRPSSNQEQLLSPPISHSSTTNLAYTETYYQGGYYNEQYYDQSGVHEQVYNYNEHQEYPPVDGYYAGEIPPQNLHYDPNSYYNPNNYPQEYPPSQEYPPIDNYQIDEYDNRMSGPQRTPSNVSSISKKSDSNKNEEKPSFTPEAIEKYRQKAKASNNPAIFLSFAKYLIEASGEANENDPDPRNAKKKKDELVQEALKIIKRLATQGMGFGRPAYSEAQFYLANCYGHGSLGLAKDEDKAFSLYIQASKQNHAGAAYRTAVCYEVGAGTKRDPHRATQFFRKAAALGDTAAMYKFGMILLYGLLSQNPNPREAIIWLKRAASNADEENPHALHELGLLHEKPEDKPPVIPSLIRSEKHAIEEFKKAADLGYAPSCFKLGSCYEDGLLGCLKDPRQSIRYYSRAAEKGDPDAELALSGWYFRGVEGVLKKSDTEAYLWARKAADKGLAKAEFAVGYYYQHGVGVQSNLEEARRWYMPQGNKRAMTYLTELKKMGSASRLRPTKHTKDQATKEDCIIC